MLTWCGNDAGASAQEGRGYQRSIDRNLHQVLHEIMLDARYVAQVYRHHTGGWGGGKSRHVLFANVYLDPLHFLTPIMFTH